jgi:hypothetical protein
VSSPFSLAWSRQPICLLEPFGGHLLHGNAINPIPFHDETQKPQKKLNNQKPSTFFSSPPPLLLLSYILFKFFRWIFSLFSFLPLPLCHQRKWNKWPRVKKDGNCGQTHFSANYLLRTS